MTYTLLGQETTFEEQMHLEEKERLIELKLIYRCYKCKHVAGNVYHPDVGEMTWADFQEALRSEK